MKAVLAKFGYAGRIKAKKRPESTFSLTVIGELSQGEGMIGVLPSLLTRESPMADKLAPTAELDVARGDPDFEVASGVTPPSPLAPRWDVGLLTRVSKGYPHPMVRTLGLQAAGRGLMPFVGDMKKSVAPHGPPMEGAHQEIVRKELMEKIGLGEMAGPYASSPFKHARICDVRCIKKNKHDPACEKVRIVSNFSKGRPKSSSVNGLCFSPKLLGFHLRACHIRDKAAVMMESFPGKTIRMWSADIPSCFRRQVNAKELLPLFVYRILTEKFGEEFVVDLCNPFGWSPAEWGWQCILAIVMWHARACGFPDLMAFVDNFFKLVAPDEKFEEVCVKLEALFKELGIELHERMMGTTFKGLGWFFDLEAAVMICDEGKFNVISSYLESMATAKKLSLLTLERAVGIMSFICDGFPVGKADLASLISLRTRGEQVLAKRGGDKAKVMVDVSERARASITFWSTEFASWDKRCAIVADFGPASGEQVTTAVDASSDWGCGGWCMAEGTTEAYFFSRPWTDEERAQAFVDKRESTGVLELKAAREAVSTFLLKFERRRILLWMDNEAAVVALEAAYSPKAAMMDEVVHIRRMCVRAGVVLRVRHVRGDVFNLVADSLSHNRIEEAICLAQATLGALSMSRIGTQ